ncbi:NAD(P)-dependent alcohol dehydrogenase [bacterium]|nr:NAD(P)-dependent alcohol dehydrogenase [bacterium]MCI0601451.1 NAD(P)-dependent alcohol dehydrogenase [bacterium]
MRVIEIGETFGIDSLRVVQRPAPVPEAGQIVLRIRAVSLNYRDLLVVNGVNRWRPAGTRVPVSDAVGVVEVLGSGVTRVKRGDRVAPIFYPRWLEGEVSPEKLVSPLGGAVADGVLAEYVAVDEESVVPVPPHLSDEEAATLPCAGVTAWNAVVGAGRFRPGDTVVVLGTGGVSLFAMQFARMLGARVIVTSSSDWKLARAAKLGASAGVNYASTDWTEAVLEITQGVGADHVVDTVGDLEKAIAAIRVGGSVAFVGLLTGMNSKVDLVALMGKSARIQAIDVGSREMFVAMNRAITFHELHPVVDRVFPFSEAVQGFQYLGGATHFGKICIRVG